MVDRPISKNGATINEFAGHGAKHTRVVGTDSVIAHYKVAVPGNPDRAKVAQVLVLSGHVGLVDGVAIDVDDALANLDFLAGQTDDPFYERLRAVERIPENDDVAPLDGLEAINKFVDEDALLIGEQRSHARAFHFYRLIQESNDDEREADGDEQIARPNTNLGSQGM